MNKQKKKYITPGITVAPYQLHTYMTEASQENVHVGQEEGGEDEEGAKLRDRKGWNDGI